MNYQFLLLYMFLVPGFGEVQRALWVNTKQVLYVKQNGKMQLFGWFSIIQIIPFGRCSFSSIHHKKLDPVLSLLIMSSMGKGRERKGGEIHKWKNLNSVLRKTG